MQYVEILYTRRMLAWYVGILAAIAALLLSTNLNGHVQIHVESDAPGRLRVGDMFVIAGYLSCIFCTLVTATLNRDRSHLPYLWTRPAPRVRIAYAYILVDLGAILIAYLATFAIAWFAFSNVPWMRVRPDPGAWITGVRFLAIPLMWFALVEAATSWNALRGGTVAGLSWGAFWLLLGINAVRLPTPIREIVALANLLNPLAYFTNRTGGGIHLMESGRPTIGLDFTLQTFLAYGVFAVAIAVAVEAWKRMEA